MKQKRTKIPLTGWLFLFFGLISIPTSIILFVKEHNLEANGVIAQAVVTDWRIHHGRYQTTYDVRYEFHIKKRVFTRSERFLIVRDNLWTGIPMELWQRSKSTKSIEVIYLEENPESNKPKVVFSFSDNVASLVFGLFSTLFGVAFVYVAKKGWLK